MCFNIFCQALNILDTPGFNQDRAAVDQEYNELVIRGDRLLLPMATILETGNHIARISDGNNRRKWGQLFVNLVTQTYEGKAPWHPIAFHTLKTILLWLGEFPDFAQREVGFADLTIIKDWEKTRGQHPMSRVRIWSIDSHLQGYDTAPWEAL